MVATYNTTTPTNRDRVRLKIADTNVAFPIFQDEEIDMALDEMESTSLAAASLCRSAAAAQARRPASISLPGATISRTAAQWLALADVFEAEDINRGDSDSSNWYTNDAAFYDAITGRASFDLDTPSTEDT